MAHYERPALVQRPECHTDGTPIRAVTDSRQTLVPRTCEQKWRVRAAAGNESDK